MTGKPFDVFAGLVVYQVEFDASLSPESFIPFAQAIVDGFVELVELVEIVFEITFPFSGLVAFYEIDIFQDMAFLWSEVVLTLLALLLRCCELLGVYKILDVAERWQASILWRSGDDLCVLYCTLSDSAYGLLYVLRCVCLKVARAILKNVDMPFAVSVFIPSLGASRGDNYEV